MDVARPSGHDRKKKANRSTQKAMIEAIVHYKTRIERETNDDDKVLHALKKLRSYPIDLAALEQTKVCQTVTGLKKRTGEVGQLARVLVHDWRQIANGHRSTESKHPSPSTPSNDDGGSDQTGVNQSPSKKVRIKVERSNAHVDSSPTKSKPQSMDMASASSSNNGHVMAPPPRKSQSPDASESIGSSGRQLSSGSRIDGDKDRSKKVKRSKKLVDSGGDGFNASMASFEDCLGLNDFKGRLPTSSSSVPHLGSDGGTARKKAKRKSASSRKSPPKDLMPPPPPPPKKSNCNMPSLLAVDPRELGSSSSSRSSSSTSSSSSSSSSSKKVFASHVDILSSLPAIQPDYRPLRLMAPDSPPSKIKRDFLVEGTTFMSPRHTRTQVFSGRRSQFLTEVPTLLNSCVKVLQENVAVLGDLMYAPYKHLKPALLRCNPDRLLYLEEMNPYILDETDELWRLHCQREFKSYEPEEFESWRELYYRMSIARTSRLRSITANISASMAKAVPVRQTKLAFVDGAVKPPRQVARQQAKYGTGAGLDRNGKVAEAATALVKLSRTKMVGGSATSSTPPPTAVKTSSETGSSSAAGSASLNGPSTSQAKAVKKVAPLMQKTLKFMKNRFRR